MTINTSRSHPCSIARLKLAHGLASSLIQCHQCWMPLAVPQLDLVRLLFYARSTMHDLALIADFVPGSTVTTCLPCRVSFPFLSPFPLSCDQLSQSFFFMSLLKSLLPFLCSQSFTRSMVNCLTEICAWPSRLGLSHGHQYR